MSRRETAASLAGVICGISLSLSTVAARADDQVIHAGDVVTLTADVVLLGTDSFIAGDAAGPRCTIHGGGFKVTSGAQPWTGRIIIHNCDIDGLGLPGGPAIFAAGASEVVIQGSTFHACGQIALVLAGDVVRSVQADSSHPWLPKDAVLVPPGHTSITFQGNTIADDSVVPAVTALADSQPSFYALGYSTGTQLFQGNRVQKSLIDFDQTNGWLIGGDTPADSNVLAGIRTGMFIERCGPMTVRGNFSSTGGRGWNQVKNLAVYSPGGGPLLVEHNVLIGMAWNTEVDCPGEIRYNLIANPVERAWVQIKSAGGTKVHHNVLIQTADSQSDDIAGGFVVFPQDDPTAPATPNSEIYNNTYDAGGNCNPGLAGAVNAAGAVLASLRSNVFTNIRLPSWTGIALINDGSGAKTVPDPMPALLKYSDYNLFYNPDASVKVNYGIGVTGKVVRTDAGFGYHDVPAGGAMNAQVAPGFVGKAPHAFPFTEASVLDGSTNVCQILAFYRQIYTPGAGSPLIDAGDPQEGPGNDIGAVGAGADNPLDQFGRFCDPATVTPLVAPASAFTCQSVPIEAGGGGGGTDPGGTGTLPGSHGFSCVCDLGSGPAPTAETTIGCFIVIAAALRLRSRKRADRAR